MLPVRAVGAILTFVFAGCGAGGPPIVTLDEYSQIHTGMSYSEATSVIGDYGVEQSRNEIPGVPGVMPTTTTVMYMWQNQDGSNMNAIFQNDKLMQKAQFGLR